MQISFNSFKDLVNFVTGGMPRTRSIILSVNDKENTGVLNLNPTQTENDLVRNGILKDISVASFKLSSIINREDIRAVFFLDRSARLARESLQCVLDKSTSKKDNLIIDSLNPDFFMKTNACIDKMIQNSVYQTFNNNSEETLMKLFRNLENIGVLKQLKSHHEAVTLNDRVLEILHKGTASELINFIKQDLIVRSDFDNKILGELKSDLEKKGLKPSDKIAIFDICSHSGNTMHAVVDAFQSLGYKSITPLVMYPEYRARSASVKNLLQYPEEILCYPYDNPMNTQGYLKKDPNSMHAIVSDPAELEAMKQVTYSRVSKFLDQHK